GASIDDMDGRLSQSLDSLSAAATFALTFASVVEAHDSFDHGDIGIGACTREPLTVDVRRQHPAVEVAGPPAARLGMVQRIDEVGPHLEGLDGQAAPPQGSDQPQRYGGLADSAVGSTHHDRTEGTLVEVGCRWESQGASSYQ